SPIRPSARGPAGSGRCCARSRKRSSASHDARSRPSACARWRRRRCARTALPRRDHPSLHHDPPVRAAHAAVIIAHSPWSPPSEMLLALAHVVGTEPWFWPDVSYTLGNLGAAIALSVAGGFLIGLLVHALPRLRRVLDPIFTSYYAVPTFVLYPLLIVFFGIGPASLIVLGALFGIVAMIVATVTAIDRVPRVLLKVARVSRLGPVRPALLMKLPAASPHLMTGLRLAVAYSVIGVIAGEFILSTEGVGRRV